MKLLEVHDILNAHLFSESLVLRQAWNDVEHAIALTDWPHGTGSFTIYPESGKKSGQGNGVMMIKIPCIQALQSRGWLAEQLPKLGSNVLGTGDLDALKLTPDGYIAFEWETGNRSSSHRALNKLFLAMQQTNTLAISETNEKPMLCASFRMISWSPARFSRVVLRTLVNWLLLVPMTTTQ